MEHAQKVADISRDVSAAYERDGFVVPIDIVRTEDALALRADFEAAEAELAGDPD